MILPVREFTSARLLHFFLPIRLPTGSLMAFREKKLHEVQ